MTVEQKVKKWIFKKVDYWFSYNPRFSILSSFFQSPVRRNILGMKRKSFYTIQIDLDKPQTEIDSKIDKGTLYEIRRAEREDIKFEISNNIIEFISFFNEFAINKGIEKTSLNYLNFNSPLIITKAIKGNEVLVMHLYIQDKFRVRLNMSASKVISGNEENKQLRNLIGYANRFLHYQDIIYFKANAIKIYDFGGFAKDTDNKQLLGINKFKLGFGGEIIEEFNYFFRWR